MRLQREASSLHIHGNVSSRLTFTARDFVITPTLAITPSFSLSSSSVTSVSFCSAELSPPVHTMAEPPAKRAKRTDSSAMWDRNERPPRDAPARDRKDKRDDRDRTNGHDDRHRRSRSRDKRRERSRSRERERDGGRDRRDRDRRGERGGRDVRDRKGRDRTRSRSRSRSRERRGARKGEIYSASTKFILARTSCPLYTGG